MIEQIISETADSSFFELDKDREMRFSARRGRSAGGITKWLHHPKLSLG